MTRSPRRTPPAPVPSAPVLSAPVPPAAPAPEEPLDGPTRWVEFVDPADPDQRIRADLTWLTSSYRCIFGAGCRGIYEERPDDGCCTLGAHFTDDDDVARVGAVVARLGPQDWELYDEGSAGADVAAGDGWTQIEGGERKTAVVDGACVLLNRPGFPAGAGCALHTYAVANGIAPHTVKPDVCWQLPIRRSYRTVELPDDTSYLEVTIAEYDRRGWGPGGHDLDWYCTRSPDAHAGGVPYYLGAEAELRELVGDAAYAVLAEHCVAHLAAVKTLRSSRPGRALLPLFVHPATLAAQDA